MNEIWFKEKAMHPVLVQWLQDNLNIQSKTIQASDSTHQEKGLNRWDHPDLVGVQFQDLEDNHYSSLMRQIQNLFDQGVTFYSFELKRELTAQSLKEYYFQAVSNSSWAHFGYLVVARLDQHNLNLMRELGRLVNAFGIGVIQLDMEKISNHQILFQAKRREILDYETMSKLTDQSANLQFNEFLTAVNSYLATTDQVLRESLLKNTQYFDEVLNRSELKRFLYEHQRLNLKLVTDTLEPPLNLNEGVEDDPSSSSLQLNLNQVDLMSAADYAPVKIEFKQTWIPIIPSTWEQVLILTCQHIYQRRKTRFDRYLDQDMETDSLFFYTRCIREWRTGQIPISECIEFMPNAFIRCARTPDQFLKLSKELLKTFHIEASIQLNPLK